MPVKPLNTRHPDWVYRLVDVGNNKQFWVPRYIVRISSKTQTLQGWQVRYRTPSLYFSDFMATMADSNEGSPDASLAMAVAHLSSIWEGNKERADKKYPTGVPGVSLRFRKLRTQVKSYQCEVRAYDDKGNILHTDYVGTTSTTTIERIAALINASRLIRNSHLLDEGTKAEVENNFQFVPETVLRGTPFEYLLNDKGAPQGLPE